MVVADEESLLVRRNRGRARPQPWEEEVERREQRGWSFMCPRGCLRSSRISTTRQSRRKSLTWTSPARRGRCWRGAIGPCARRRCPGSMWQRHGSGLEISVQHFTKNKLRLFCEILWDMVNIVNHEHVLLLKHSVNIWNPWNMWHTEK